MAGLQTGRMAGTRANGQLGLLRSKLLGWCTRIEQLRRLYHTAAQHLELRHDISPTIVAQVQAGVLILESAFGNVLLWQLSEPTCRSNLQRSW